MRVRIILILSAAVLLISAVVSQKGTCAKECGGSTVNDCADFNDPTSSADKCYSCAAGYVGGQGTNSGPGATCKK